MKKLNFYTLTLIIFLCFGLTIGGSMLTSYWRTERTTTPKLIKNGSFEENYDPYDIRGSYTVAEVLELFEIPKGDFYKGLNLPQSFPVNSQLKNLEALELEGIAEEHLGVSDVQEFVAAYIGLVEPDSEAVENITEPTSTIAPHTETYTEPKGGTPLSQVFEWGVTKEMLEKKFNVNFEQLGLTPENTLRDLTDSSEIKMYDLKEYISSKMN
ncbi:MAG: hypothetical protein KAX49_05620 [Halanaerobiales bacterium]|nr:hypothetical protein [Halanaerobiales bacterium]